MNRLGSLGAGFAEARDFGGTRQAKTYGPYTTHCEAAVAAMLLAQIASEVGTSAEVVLQLNGAMLQVVWQGKSFARAGHRNRRAWAPNVCTYCCSLGF